MSETKKNTDQIQHDSALHPLHPDQPPTPRTVQKPEVVKEIGGPAGLEPTRYGDWERRGRCIDF